MVVDEQQILSDFPHLMHMLRVLQLSCFVDEQQILLRRRTLFFAMVADEQQILSDFPASKCTC